MQIWSGVEASLGHDGAGRLRSLECLQWRAIRSLELQEKDHFEEEEADDLINFVENLDFDKFA